MTNIYTKNLADFNGVFNKEHFSKDNLNKTKQFLKSNVTNFLTLGINAKTDFTKLFTTALGISKVSLLFIFILVTIVYQIKYKNVTWAKTGLNSPESWKEWLSASVVATFSIFGILVYYYTRSLSEDTPSFGEAIKEHWISLLIIGLIIFLLILLVNQVDLIDI